MPIMALLRPVLLDENLTRGLGDAEARVLVEWLVERIEFLVEAETAEGTTKAEIDRLCRRARAIARFVQLWCHQRERGAALQLAGAERFPWPLPTHHVDACELMQNILFSEAASFAA